MTVFPPNEHKFSAPSKWVITSSSTRAVTKLNTDDGANETKTQPPSPHVWHVEAACQRRGPSRWQQRWWLWKHSVKPKRGMHHNTSPEEVITLPSPLLSILHLEEAEMMQTAKGKTFFFPLSTKAKISSGVLLTLQITSRPRFTWRARVLGEQSELGKIKQRSKSNLNTYVLKGVGINPL